MALDTVIMVHGAGGGGWEYRFWAPVFQKAGWKVVARDLLPARGGLARTTVGDYLRQIVAWTPRKHGRLVLVGASMGGPLALAAARRLRADAVVLVNPVPEVGMPSRRPSPPVVRWANGPFKDTRDAMPDSDDLTRLYAWRKWRDESGAVLNRLARGLRSPRPRCPILLVVSGKDTDVLPALSRATAKRLQADVVTLPQASHVGPLLGRERAEGGEARPAVAEISPRVAVSALFALDGAVLGGWVSHLPDVQQNLRLSTGALGLTLLASSAGAVTFIVALAPSLIGRFGHRRVSLFMAALVLALIPLLMWAPSPLALAANLFVMGAANATLDVAMNANALAIQERMGRPILSSVHGWWSVGGFLGGAGTALANKLHVAPFLHLLFASGALAFLLAALAPALVSDDGGATAEEGPRFALPHGPLLALGLIGMLAFFAEGAVWDWSAIYFRNSLEASKEIAALGFDAGAGAMALGRLFGDPFVARLGPRAALRASGFLTAGGLLVAMAVPHPAAAFAGFALAGLGLANTVPVLFAAAARVSSVGLAAVSSLSYAAFLGGPPLVGNVAQFTSLRAGLALVGVLASLIGFVGPRALASAQACAR